MKKIIVSLCCLLFMSGCQKSIDIVYKTDGFQVEKIASLPTREEKDNGISFYKCKEDTVCLRKENTFTRQEMIYEVNINNHSVKERKVSQSEYVLNEYILYNDYQTEDGLVIETTFLISDTEKVISRREIIGETKTKTILYQSDKEEKIISEYHMHEEETEFSPNFNGNVMMLEDRSVLVYYTKDESVVSERIEAGGKFSEIDRVPLIEDGMKIESYYFYPPNDKNVTYSNETKRRIYDDETMFETKLNEGYVRISEDTVILKEIEENTENILKTSILEINTQKRTELSENLNGMLFSAYEWGYKESKQFLFMPYNNSVENQSQFLMVGEFQDNQLQFIELPFEVDQYLFEILDKNRFAFITEGTDGKPFDLYLVTLEK